MDAKKTIIFGGDFYLNQNDYTFSDNIIDIFNSADYCVLNLEAPIIKNNKTEIYKKAGVNIFQKENSVDILKKLNIEYLSGANNHIFDYGSIGIKSTIDILKNKNINFGGFGFDLNQAKKEMNLEGSNISLICVGEEEFGVADEDVLGIFSMYSTDIIKKIKELKSLGRYVIVYSHGGGELIPLPSKYIISRYKKFIDSGADLVVGHHPHVPQGIEKYKGKYIFYSLGNFIHSQFKKSWGIVVKIEIEKSVLLNYDILFLKLDNNNLSILENSEKYNNYINLVSSILNDREEFNGVYQEQACYMFDSYYKGYFTNLFKGKIIFFIKRLVKIFILKKESPFLSKNSNDFLLLYHLIRNKSHINFIKTAIGLKTREIKDFRTSKTKDIFNYLKGFMKYE